ncbi:hypothetical protein F3J44_00340 [Pantoea sp. Tr-811]|nr:hypothetical protein [Pantoea sp. Tr-811]
MGNPLEIVFCSVILGGMLVSLITAELFGRAPAWERNWQGGTHKGALDIEHGSIGELSQAVATLPERIVGNMPGLLLIVGLLGTFLGLGMALDKASAILQGNADSLNAMSDSLSQLTGMMKDLGTKFKTSTWGIIAFIVLKLWDSARWSAESRRTGWCVDRMKREIDQARATLTAQGDTRERLARENLQAVGKQLVQAVAAQSQVLGNELKQLKLIEFKRGQKQDEQFGQLAIQMAEQLQQLQQLNAPSASLAVLAGFSVHLPRLEALEQHGQSLQQIDAGLARLQEQAERNSQQAAGFSQQAELQAQALLAALAKQHAQHIEVQRGLADQQLEQARTLTSLASETNQVLETVGQHTQASQQSLEQFVSASRENLKALENAGSTMGQAAEQLAASAGALESGVKVMEQNVGGAIDKLNGDFHGHLQNMQQSLDGNIARLSEVMNELQSGLMSNVDQMSQDFSRNTAAMSENLKGATDNISHAVNGLTGEVQDVMQKVSENIESANVSQRKVSAMVVSTNDGLNETVEQMKQQMGMIAQKVTEGLSDVSENSKRMDRVGKQLVKFPELAESLGKLHEHFQALLAQGAQTSQVLEQLPTQLRADLNQNGQLLSAAVANLAQLSEQLNTLTARAQRSGQQVAELPQAMAERMGEQFSNHLLPLQDAAGTTVALLQRLADQARQPEPRPSSDEPLTA